MYPLAICCVLPPSMHNDDDDDDGDDDGRGEEEGEVEGVNNVPTHTLYKAPIHYTKLPHLFFFSHDLLFSLTRLQFGPNSSQ